MYRKTMECSLGDGKVAGRLVGLFGGGGGGIGCVKISDTGSKFVPLLHIYVH